MRRLKQKSKPFYSLQLKYTNKSYNFRYVFYDFDHGLHTIGTPFIIINRWYYNGNYKQ